MADDWNPRPGERWRWTTSDGTTTVFTITKLTDRADEARGCITGSCSPSCSGCCWLVSESKYYEHTNSGQGNWTYEGDEFDKWVSDTRQEAGLDG